MKRLLLAACLALVASVGLGSRARAEVRPPMTHYVFCWYVDYDPWVYCDYSQDDWN